MVASSLSADDITAPHAVGVLIALAADVSVCCAAYASVHCLWPLPGRAPTGSLLINMPQLVLPGSLERWAMCPMFVSLPPIVCHRNPRWPGALTLMCLWARLSIIT